MKPEAVVDYLFRLSEGKLQLMEQLLNLTMDQSEILKSIDEEALKQLNRAIEEKQKVAEKVDILDKEFLQKFEELKKFLGVASFAEVQGEPVAGFKKLKGKIQEIVSITDRIQEIDQQNSANARVHMDAIKEQLKTVKIGRRANQGYGKKFEVNQPILIDKKK